MVTQRSAKPRCAGSIPAYASTRNYRLVASYQMRPGDGTGIRSRLKIGGRKACGFDSHPGHKQIYLLHVLKFEIDFFAPIAVLVDNSRQCKIS